MHEILEKIGELGLVPVVKIERAEDALYLGKALIEGDLSVAEITFRTAAAAVGCCFGDCSENSVVFTASCPDCFPLPTSLKHFAIFLGRLGFPSPY